jgi:phosphopantothenoylcysteine synthetase/decarboxylase
VGFAAETDDLIKNANKKLVEKNIDAIVANDVSAEGVGFTHETNAVTILTSDGQSRSISLRSKREIAEEYELFFRNKFFFVSNFFYARSFKSLSVFNGCNKI